MATPEPLDDLSALLRKLFNEDALRQWVFKALGRDAFDALPGNKASLKTLAFEAARLAEQHGRIDEAFFETLLQERPNQRERILKVAFTLQSLPAAPGNRLDVSTPQVSAPRAAIIGYTGLIPFILIIVLGLLFVFRIPGGLGCGIQGRTPAIPKADPARFSIAVADLEGDGAGELKRIIVHELINLEAETLSEGKDGRKEGMQILDVPRVIQLGRSGLPMASVEQGHEQAHVLLEETGASVLLWGRVLVHGDRTAPALYITVAQSRPDEMRSKIYMLGNDLRLPVQLWSDLGDVLRLLVVTQASLFFDQEDQYLVDRLSPFIGKVEALTRSHAFYTTWTDDSQGMVHLVLGYAWYLMGEQTEDIQAIEKAVTAYKAALRNLTHERVPFDWAMTQNNLGAALLALGEREQSTERMEQALSAFRAALEVFTRERGPVDWARTQNKLGVALLMLEEKEQEQGTERLEQAVSAFRSALEVLIRERVPLDWSMAQNNLGLALKALGNREQETEHLEQAVSAFRSALEVQTRERVPLAWAKTQNNLGLALGAIGEREQGTEHLEQAVSAFRSALEEQTRERVPLKWADTQDSLGLALSRLGDRAQGTEHLKQAVSAFRSALEVRTREGVPLDWARTQTNLGLTLSRLGEREQGTEHLKQAVSAFRSALEVLTRESAPLDWVRAQHNLGTALQTLGETGQGTEHLEQAVVVFRSTLEVLAPSTFPLAWASIQHNLGGTLAVLAQRTGSTRQLCQALQAHLDAWGMLRSQTDYAEMVAVGVTGDLDALSKKSLSANICGQDIAALADVFLQAQQMPPSP